MTYDAAIHAIARGIEIVGVVVLVLGALVATLVFAARVARRSPSFDITYHAYRADLGRAILLGLEFLVAADIILSAAIEPTFRGLAILGLIVLIRTFLSFTLELEVSRRWPWQGRAPAQGAAQPGAPGS